MRAPPQLLRFPSPHRTPPFGNLWTDRDHASQPITDTSIARDPAERAGFSCPITIRSRSQNPRKRFQTLRIVGTLGCVNLFLTNHPWQKSRGAWRGAPDGVAPLHVRKGAFDALKRRVWSTWISEVTLSPPRGRPLKNSMKKTPDCAIRVFAITIAIASSIARYRCTKFRRDETKPSGGSSQALHGKVDQPICCAARNDYLLFWKGPCPAIHYCKEFEPESILQFWAHLLVLAVNVAPQYIPLIMVNFPSRPHLSRLAENVYTRAVPEVQGDEIFTQERSQKFKVMKFWNLVSEKCHGFLVANFLSTFPRKNRIQICHRKLHHILHCKKWNLSPATHSGSILA